MLCAFLDKGLKLFAKEDDGKNIVLLKIIIALLENLHTKID